MALPDFIVQIILSFSWRITYVCKWAALSAHFLTVEIWKPDSILSFCLVFASFHSTWQCFCYYNIPKHVVDLLFMYWRSMVLGKVLHRSFLVNFMSIPGFYWDGWMDHAYPLQQKIIQLHQWPFSKADFLSHELPNFSILWSLVKWRISQVIKC